MEVFNARGGSDVVGAMANFAVKLRLLSTDGKRNVLLHTKGYVNFQGAVNEAYDHVNTNPVSRGALIVRLSGDRQYPVALVREGPNGTMIVYCKGYENMAKDLVSKA